MNFFLGGGGGGGGGKGKGKIFVENMLHALLVAGIHFRTQA